jgi:hypothetical protein
VPGEAHSAWHHGRIGVVSVRATANSAAASSQEANQKFIGDRVQSLANDDAAVGTATTSSSARLTSNSSSYGRQPQTVPSATVGTGKVETAVVLIEGIQQRTVEPEQIAADSSNSMSGLPSGAPGDDSIAGTAATDTAGFKVSAVQTSSYHLNYDALTCTGLSSCEQHLFQLLSKQLTVLLYAVFEAAAPHLILVASRAVRVSLLIKFVVYYIT